MIKIITLTTGPSGDTANALGVQAALVKHYKTAGFEVETGVSQEEIEALFGRKAGLDAEHYIVIGAGEKVADAFAGFKRDNVTSVWSGHQPPDNLMDIKDFIDIIHLPEYVTTPQTRQVLGRKLVTTPHGVPHNFTPESVKNSYETYISSGTAQENPIPPADKYLLVALGGDAPTTSGEQKLFTEAEAKELGKYAGQAAQALGYTILATNAPRTGAHTKSAANAEPAPGEDAVSLAFKQGVADSGLAKEKMAFFPFDPNRTSALPALLGAVASHGSAALMPGDSASMLTQALDVLPPKSLAVYPTAAMSEHHIAQVEVLVRNGWAMQQKADHTLKPRFSSAKPPLAAETMANKVIDLMREKGLPSPPKERQLSP